MGTLDDIDSVNLHSVTIGVFENVNRPVSDHLHYIGINFARQVEERKSAFDMFRGYLY